MIYQFTASLRSASAIPSFLSRFREVFIQLSTQMSSKPEKVFFPIEDLSRHMLLELVFDGTPHLVRLTANDDTKIATLEVQELPEGWIKIISWDCFI